MHARYSLYFTVSIWMVEYLFLSLVLEDSLLAP